MMTPKEKAKELVDKFRNEFTWVEKDHNVDLYRDTKQCALIAVDEILKVASFYNDSQAEVTYWKEVKQEIEILYYMEDWFYERLKKVIKTPFKKENEMLKNDETIVLNFLYNRLIEKYGENENYDYMIKFREIINSRSIG